MALVAAGAVTLALAAPAAGLELGQPDDRNLTPDTTQRQAYDRLADGFGAGVNGPLVVAVSLPRDGSEQALDRLADDLGSDREVADVSAPVVNEAGDTAVITVTPRHGPQDDATRALVDRLRADVIPTALRDSGATAYVGGRTARYGDEAEKIASRIPLFAAAVVGLSLLLLLAAFRSWRISLLSAVFNLASIAAAYGVVALAFQTSTGAGLLGVEQQPVVPYVPLFMFAILFGLSTDYNVFLLSRVREEWSRHADHRAGDRRRHRRHPQDHHRRRRHHDRRLPRLRDRPRPRDQDDRHRARHGRARRRHARPAVPGTRRAHAARRPPLAEPPQPSHDPTGDPRPGERLLTQPVTHPSPPGSMLGGVWVSSSRRSPLSGEARATAARDRRSVSTFERPKG